MKTIVTDLDMFKATIKQDGKIDVTLTGGKQLTGQLTAAEVEQLLFRVSVISDGVLTFDPEPRDLVNVHDSDVATLEAQAIELDSQRETIKVLTESVGKLETELVEARNAAIELGKRLTTVHNVQPSTEQASSVHNVQSEEPVA